MTQPLDKALADVAEPKFTRGPWKVAISGRGSLCVASDDAWICGEIDNQPHELLTNEAKANAHLIAAAPRLYEVLAGVRPLVLRAVTANGMSEKDAVESTWLGHLDAVLAKARGES
jgi:hypothetical protein